MISHIKKQLFVFLSFYYLCRKFFNVVIISSCKQELVAINLNQEICYSQCLGHITEDAVEFEPYFLQISDV